MSGYYPEFYLRKRQREQAYRRLTVVAVGFLLLVVLGGTAGYFIYNNLIAPRRSAPGASPELAEQGQALKTQQRMASAKLPEELEGAPPAERVDLHSIGYSESFPQVQVGLDGVAPVETPAEASETPADPAAASSPELETFTEPTPPAPDDRAAAVTPERGVDEPESDAERLSRQKREADERQRREQVRLDAQREKDKQAEREKQQREQEKKDQARRDAEKKEAAAADKPAPVEAKKEEPKPAAKPAGHLYTVYASKYLDKEKAEADKSALSSIGLSGSVVDLKTGDYLLMVGTLEDPAAASALESKLKSSGFGGAFTTRKVKK